MLICARSSVTAFTLAILTGRSPAQCSIVLSSARHACGDTRAVTMEPSRALGPGDEVQEPTSLEREDSLVAAAIAGDETAFTRLYDLHFDRVYRHIVYRVGHSQDAEDLAQHVFIQAWRAL